MRAHSALIFGVLLGCGCISNRSPDPMSTGSAAGDVLPAVVMAVGASAASRAAGGCYASCPPGTQCIEATGFCETLPCRGLCAATETCVERPGEQGRGECVRIPPPRMQIDAKKDAPSDAESKALPP